MDKAFREKLETLHGGSLSFSLAATRLGISERALMQRMTAGEVIYADCDNRYMFPQFQFQGNGMLPGVQALLKYCVKDDPEWLLQFLWTPLIGDLSPVDMLRQGVTEIELHALIALAEVEFGSDGK